MATACNVGGLACVLAAFGLRPCLGGCILNSGDSAATLKITLNRTTAHGVKQRILMSISVSMPMPFIGDPSSNT